MIPAIKRPYISYAASRKLSVHFTHYYSHQSDVPGVTNTMSGLNGILLRNDESYNSRRLCNSFYSKRMAWKLIHSF